MNAHRLALLGLACGGFVASCLLTTPVHSATPAVAAGENHSVALKSDGTVWQWGFDGFYTPLGNGLFARTPYRPTPRRMSGLADVIAIAAGNNHNVALKRDGTVWAWGDNGWGQLGDGTQEGRAAPVQVNGLADVVAIAAGGEHTAALTRNGSVWIWGSGLYEPYDFFHPIESRTTPLEVIGVTGVTAIAADYGPGSPFGGKTFALKGDGSVWVIPTGNGSLRNPYPAGLTGVVAIAAGGFGGIALKSDGSVWTVRDTPAEVAGLTGVVAMAIGGLHTIVLKTDGSVWTWGGNQSGQLGDGTSSPRAPTQVAGLADVIAISGGLLHTLAVKRDGTVWAWGENREGQLGDGTLAARLRPVVVLRENGDGSLATRDWFFDADPAAAKTIPADKVPPFLLLASGDPVSTTISIDASIRFRDQDLGKGIYVFAYALAPSSNACYLSQLAPSGLQQTLAAALRSQGTVTSSQGQAVTILDHVSSTRIGGACACVGVGATAEQSVLAGNVRCAATFVSSAVCPCLDSSAERFIPDPPTALSGVWWNANESGWGISFIQRRDNVFAAWYTYDASGDPKWYVAPNCQLRNLGFQSGPCDATLYEVRGPAFFGTAFNPSAVNVVTAGTLSLNFQDNSAASMTYTVAGQTRTVAITRQPIPGANAPPGANFTDLWWNPGEPGWGMTITQQFDVMFLAWYVYDSAGKPIWYVASNCAASSTGCTGTLYRTTGLALGPTFDSTRVRVFTVGTVTLTFSDANNGTLSYTVDGVSGSKSITRQTF